MHLCYDTHHTDLVVCEDVEDEYHESLGASGNLVQQWRNSIPSASTLLAKQWSFYCTKSKFCASVGHHLIWAMPILSWLEVESRLQLMADKTTLYVSSPTCKNMPTKHEIRYHESSAHILEHHIQRARWCAKSMLSSISKPVPLCFLIRLKILSISFPLNYKRDESVAKSEVMHSER